MTRRRSKEDPYDKDWTEDSPNDKRELGDSSKIEKSKKQGKQEAVK